MKRVFRTLLVIIGLGLAVSCSEQEFSSIPSDTCKNVNGVYGDGACVETPDGLNSYSYNVGSCKADILFVVDNSGSMSAEQTELANRFPQFLSSINNLDYQIAITTTDVSSSPNNYDPNDYELSARQDGKLIKFPNGNKFLKKSTSNAQYEFESTIRRPETQNCDSGNKSSCPTSDERGIYAVNYALNQATSRGNFGPNKFFRQDSHLAIVFLSDENVRSDAGLSTSNSLYKPTQYDTPQSLIGYVQSTFGETKTFSAHPIVIQSALTHANSDGSLVGAKDVTCHKTQADQQTSRQDLKRYGTWYEQLSVAKVGTVDGSEVSDLGGLVSGQAGSICEGNFTPILAKIGASISKNVQVTELSCEPAELSVKIGDTELAEGDYTLNGKRLELPSTCENINVSYKCPRSV